MQVVDLRTPGLGDASYLIVHDSVVVLVDPQRDIARFLAAVETHDVEVAYVLETHLHNDYVSWGLDVANATGASLAIPAAAGVAFGHLPALHEEDFQQVPSR